MARKFYSLFIAFSFLVTAISFGSESYDRWIGKRGGQLTEAQLEDMDRKERTARKAMEDLQESFRDQMNEEFDLQGGLHVTRS